MIQFGEFNFFESEVSYTELQKPHKPTNLVWRNALAKQRGRSCVSVLRYPSAGKVEISL